TVRHSLQLVRLAIFAGFILLGLRISIVRVEGRRRAINALLVYVLLVQAALIVAQNEAWPFAMYPMMAVQATDRAAPHNGLSLRVYRLVWNVEDFARSRKLLARTLICEYRR